VGSLFEAGILLTTLMHALEGSALLKIHIQTDVTAAVGTGEELSTVSTVTVPERAYWGSPRNVIFGYPGGGYSRQYFDLQLGDEYSEAEYHAANGFIFVACDHVGAGDSDIPTRPLDYRAVARANCASALEVLVRLGSGDLAPAIPALDIAGVVGVGQSFGGFLLTLSQAYNPLFDGVAFLGWSGVEMQMPWTRETSLSQLDQGRETLGADNPRRAYYFRPDIPRSIVDRALARAPGHVGSAEVWASAHYPGGPAVDPAHGPLGPNAVTAEAASIECPVFVGAGDVDLIGDLRTEATAYPASTDITLCSFPMMGHMHNFAGSRRMLWDRLSDWATTVTRGSAFRV